MLSGDVIWCSTCGSYADLRVGGLTEACTGKHTGPWKGGGKRGQLNDLRKNRHPKNATPLPPAIAESTMTLDLATTASTTDVAEANNRTSRYTAKDKAIARAHASNPHAALTDEKQQWINNKRNEAIQRATRMRALADSSPVATSSSSSTCATRIRASCSTNAQRSYCDGRPPLRERHRRFHAPCAPTIRSSL